MIGTNGKKCTKAFSMIKKIKRSALDLEKYTACLQHSINYRVYAEYWYLDTLTNSQWDCLVLNDYEAIMPLPYQKKLGFKIIAQPLYCQQLGIFYTNQVTSDQFNAFLKQFSKNIVRGYHFNEENRGFFKDNTSTKINQILDLNLDYSVYRTTIRKNRKQELNKGLPLHHRIIQSDSDLYFLELLQNEYKSLQKQLNLKQLIPLIKAVQAEKIGITITIFMKNEAVASSFYIKSGNRLIQLCNSKKLNSLYNYNTYIVDYMIQMYQNQNMILDFEGSSLKGVNNFNASFRATTKEIPIYKSKFLEMINFS